MPAFDAFYASQVETIGDEALIEQMNREAGAKLLDRIGPAMLLDAFAGRRDRLERSPTSGRSWSRAFSRSSPAARRSARRSRKARPTGSRTARSRARGASRADRSTFDPPAQTPDELKLVRQEQPDGPGLVRCLLQAEPARKLPNLRGIPILIVAERGVLPRALRSLHGQVPRTGRRQEYVRAARPISASAATAT